MSTSPSSATPSLENIRIFHIVHLNRLSSILQDGYLWSDKEVGWRMSEGANIGIRNIKARRRKKRLSSHSYLTVGSCVPFNFCFRSVMLHSIFRSHVDYQGGQNDILHLVARFSEAIEWADSESLRWAFTTTNAGAKHFVDYASVQFLDEIDWCAVKTRNWGGGDIPPSVRDNKQAEFLVERRFVWNLVRGIGVISENVAEKVRVLLDGYRHIPQIRVSPDWYY